MACYNLFKFYFFLKNFTHDNFYSPERIHTNTLRSFVSMFLAKNQFLVCYILLQTLYLQRLFENTILITFGCNWIKL